MEKTWLKNRKIRESFLPRKFPAIRYGMYVYSMAGNFRGVLFFDIFMVDLAVMKLSHPRKLTPTVTSP